MLTELQERVARIIAELPEALGFALAGGAALLVHGLTERSTNDLDYFTTAPSSIARSPKGSTAHSAPPYGSSKVAWPMAPVTQPGHK